MYTFVYRLKCQKMKQLDIKYIYSIQYTPIYIILHKHYNKQAFIY